MQTSRSPSGGQKLCGTAFTEHAAPMWRATTGLPRVVEERTETCRESSRARTEPGEIGVAEHVAAAEALASMSLAAEMLTAAGPMNEPRGEQRRAPQL